MKKDNSAFKDRAKRAAKALVSLLIAAALLFSGVFILTVKPPITPQEFFWLGMPIQLFILWIAANLLLYDRLGRCLPAGVAAIASTAFPFSLMAGGWTQSTSWVFHLFPLLWVASCGRKRWMLLAVFIVLFPEILIWHNSQTERIPFLPPAVPVDLLPSSWQVFWEGVIQHAAAVLLITLLATLIRPYRVAAFGTGLHFPPIAKAAAPDQTTIAGLQTSAEAKIVREAIPTPAVQTVEMRTSLINDAEAVDLRGILESIVYFMSKNFKAHSALGFLSIDEGRTFVLNAKFSRSKNLRDDVLVYPGSGIVAKALQEPSGFMTGNVATYSDKLEYYSRSEEVNSIIVVRVVDENSMRVTGLLVVDNQDMRAFDDHDKDLLQRFSLVASKLISNARMSKILTRSSQQNEIVYNISKQLAQENYTRGVIGVLIENLRKVFEADRLVVCDVDPRTGKGRILRITGDLGDLEEGLIFEIDDPFSLYGMAFVNRIEYLETEMSRENRYRFLPVKENEKAPSEVMVAPLLDEKSSCVAVIGLEAMRPGTFQKRTLILLQTIMANASSALTRARMFQKVEKQATIDGLTHIPNHRHFQDTLDAKLEKAEKTREPFTLLLMDIDHFKKFNDTYGHPLGDEVLRNVARAIGSSIRKPDFAARYGGEEFTVLLDGIGRHETLQAAERVREAVQSLRIPHEGKELSVTVSIGSATFPDDGQIKKDLIDRADQAMYQSKQTGRNRVTQWYTLRNKG